MPRKGLRPRDRRGAPSADFKYKSVLVSRFVNKLNYAGKKCSAQNIFYGAMDVLRARIEKQSLQSEKGEKETELGLFNKAIENIRPLLEVRPRRVGGATYQVPREVRPVRSYTVAMRWIIDATRQRSGKPMADRLADELLAGYKREGVAYKKREDTHKMAESNRAFAHYRW